MTDYQPGDRVAYDENTGVVIGLALTTRPGGGKDYWVRWDDNEKITKVWGSDLI